MINGVARFGTTALMTKLSSEGERVTIGGRQRMLFLKQEFADEVVAGIELGQAKKTLVDALHRLPELASDLENSRTGPARAIADRLRGGGRPVWFLALDEIEPTGSELRPRLPGPQGRESGPRIGVARSVPLSQLVTPMTLDPLTVADDNDFLERVVAQTVLPQYVRNQLPGMY